MFTANILATPYNVYFPEKKAIYMIDEDVKFSTEINFKSFMSQYDVIEDLDDIIKTVPKGVAIADYTVRDIIVIELKTLKVDPTQKMETYYQEVMARPDFPAIYGELDLRRVASILPDGERVIRNIENKAFRQIEKIISKANKQIESTIQYLHMDSRTYGALIIINELAEFFEPDVLVSYINKMLSVRINGKFRFSNINQVILLQNTHKIKHECSQSLVIPIYGIINGNLKSTEIGLKADEILNTMIKSYSHFNGSNYREEDDFEAIMNIEKINSDSKNNLNGQEIIEERYRLNRYMKDFTEDRLIKHGSLVVSLTIAMGLKENPLIMQNDKKRHVYKAFIELLEESRLRPFDLRKLNIDAKKFAMKKNKYKLW